MYSISKFKENVILIKELKQNQNKVKSNRYSPLLKNRTRSTDSLFSETMQIIVYNSCLPFQK